MSCEGIVKWFDRKKGIGFVTPNDSETDIFIHRRNFVTLFTLDEGDTIYYDMGEFQDRPTALKISRPPGAENKEPRRRSRGRNAKNELDAEASEEGKAPEEAAGDDSAATAPKGEGRAAGGRDSKTHRRPGNRSARNDRGVAADGSVAQGKGSARRRDNKSDAQRAAKDGDKGGDKE